MIKKTKPEPEREWPESPYTVSSPLYLASAQVRCWECNSELTVVCLLAANVKGCGDVAYFSHNTTLPEEIVAHIQERYPAYQYISGYKSYNNVCPKCNKISGDFHLISEPDGPFFAMSVEKAQQVTLEEIPLTGSVLIEASIGFGATKLLLEHAKRVG